MTGPTETLAGLAANVRYKDLPKEVIQKGKECILDTLGCILAGCRGEEAPILLGYMEEAGGAPEATVLGFGARTSVPNAALVSGTLGHALDFDDSQHSLMGHPSVVILPAVLSMGEKMKSSGEAVLEAFAAGFEVTCKLGSGVNPRLYNNGWHATSVIGTLGATAAAGKLLGLDPEKMASALGFSASLACGLRENFGTMTKPLHAGRAAENGVLAALLARSGFTASQRALEARNGFCAAFSGTYDLNRILDTFGNPFEIVSPGVHPKRYPSCLEAHAILEATLLLVQPNDLRPEEVESVECGVAPLAVDILIHPNPQTGLEGKFSAQYAVTTAILHRKASLEQFTDEAVRDARAQAMNRKVKVIALRELEKSVQSAIVTIRMNNGREFTRKLDLNADDPERRMSLDEIIDKYRSCAGLMIGPEAIDASMEKILCLEQVKDIGEVVPLLVRK
jgi:2-methylcitrate dehydratase PrpD